MTITSFNDFVDKGRTVFYLILAFFLESIVPVRKNRIICWSFHQHKYACNPRAITEFILKNHPNDFEIYWAFEKGIDTSELDPRIKVVYNRTFAYWIALGSSRFVLNNSRSYIYEDFFIKKKNQIYVMTWHGSIGTKPCEKDAESVLPEHYIKRAKRDSKMCDLLISGNDFLTALYKRAFWYEGEILENCFPRNDIYFDKTRIQQQRKKICHYYGVPEDNLLLLYAPTFRSDYNTDVFKLDWSRVVDAFEHRFKRKVCFIAKLHPNYLGGYKKGNLFKGTGVIDAIDYPDLSDLVCASDFFISDYSSSIFDMAYMFKPCFVYAPDHESYDRGYYFQIKDMPFPYSFNEVELCKVVLNFNEEDYKRQLCAFFSKIGLKEDGQGARRLYEWMISKKEC